MWGIGVLTWNDPTTCAQTLAALYTGVTRQDTDHIVVLDNGSIPAFAAPAALPITIWRSPTNLGAGGGLSLLVRQLLAQPIDHLLVLEDDWLLDRPFALADLALLLADPTVGQLRLGHRPAHPGQRYYTYGLDGDDARMALAAAQTEPLIAYPGGHYQRLRSLWSNNPFTCRRDIAERFLLTGQDELRMARPYYASGLTTLSTTPGHFRHSGDFRSRRTQAGWTK